MVQFMNLSVSYTTGIHEDSDVKLGITATPQASNTGKQASVSANSGYSVFKMGAGMRGLDVILLQYHTQPPGAREFLKVWVFRLIFKSLSCPLTANLSPILFFLFFLLLWPFSSSPSVPPPSLWLSSHYSFPSPLSSLHSSLLYYLLPCDLLLYPWGDSVHSSVRHLLSSWQLNKEVRNEVDMTSSKSEPMKMNPYDIKEHNITTGRPIYLLQ